MHETKKPKYPNPTCDQSRIGNGKMRWRRRRRRRRRWRCGCGCGCCACGECRDGGAVAYGQVLGRYYYREGRQRLVLWLVEEVVVRCGEETIRDLR